MQDRKVHERVKKTNGRYFDIVLKKTPKAARVDISKMKEKGGVTIDADRTSGTVFKENAQGELHFSGTVSGKGSVKIPFTVYGKKYTIKVTAK